ncbi:hypothetical protein CSC68_07625 [Pseudoxanthomonas suwonensis]|nr:hypothetical protein CSC68_07625 [Pseudoxanthomonas suwonensis]
MGPAPGGADATPRPRANPEGHTREAGNRAMPATREPAAKGADPTANAAESTAARAREAAADARTDND